LGVDVEERDINKDPPPRELLERHVDEERFLDYVSKRSPVFKTRPLPRSKREALDLMLEQPNLIKRPVLVKGDRAVFGFDRDGFRALA
jgi:arsenate reductase-like glutaredoxin family protein